MVTVSGADVPNKCTMLGKRRPRRKVTVLEVRKITGNELHFEFDPSDRDSEWEKLVKRSIAAGQITVEIGEPPKTYIGHFTKFDPETGEWEITIDPPAKEQTDG